MKTFSSVLLCAALCAGCSSEPSSPSGDSAGSAADIGSSADLGADQSPKHDLAFADPFPCGDTLTCKSGQYCIQEIPGICGGIPKNADGSCPADCADLGCGGDCTCSTYTCGTLPAGCDSCDCIHNACGEGFPGGDQCGKDPKTLRIDVSCPNA